MQITFIVAVSENNVIGLHNDLPWHLSDDLKFFKKNTLNKPIVMGRKTFESFKKPLPYRLNIIISRSLKEAPADTMLFSNIESCIQFLKNENYPEICIIGGGEIFKQTLHLANTILLTRVHTDIHNGEVFFPELDKNKWKLDWQELHPKDEKHIYSFTFQKWIKKR